MTRDELHQLVDSLPEGAFQRAGFSLELLQNWPEHPPRELIQQRMRELWTQQRRPGAQFGAGPALMPPYGLFGLGEGAKAIPGGHTFGYHDGDTYVLQTRLQFRGHRIETMERCRMEGSSRLHYGIDVTGPGGATARHAFVFDVTAES